jgi:hypothetical protein
MIRAAPAAHPEQRQAQARVRKQRVVEPSANPLDAAAVFPVPR